MRPRHATTAVAHLLLPLTLGDMAPSLHCSGLQKPTTAIRIADANPSGKAPFYSLRPQSTDYPMVLRAHTEAVVAQCRVSTEIYTCCSAATALFDSKSKAKLKQTKLGKCGRIEMGLTV